MLISPRNDGTSRYQMKGELAGLGFYLRTRVLKYSRSMVTVASVDDDMLATDQKKKVQKRSQRLRSVN